jgi:FhuF 2Fe-2S C-terminal domain/Ferric iron reductase FhuF-like transporter
MTTTVIAAEHPIRASLTKLAALYEYAPTVEIGVPDEPGWLPADTLFSPESPQLRDVLGAMAASYSTTKRDVAASFVFHSYGWTVSCLAVGAYLTHGRLPDLCLSNVAVHLDEKGFVDRLALVSGRFWTTTSDPEAGHPDAMIATDDTIDLLRLRAELELHFEPVIDAVRAQAPFGKRAMWLSLADNSAWCLHEFSERLKLPGDRAEEIALFTQGPGSRLRGGTKLLVLDVNGEHHAFVERGSCCLSYRLPDAEKCNTCPLQKPEERRERLRAFVLTGE